MSDAPFSHERCLCCDSGMVRIHSAVVLMTAMDDRGAPLILAVSRRERPSDMNLPGGKLEPGESAVQCAVRELLEETGVAVTPADLTSVYDRITRSGGTCRVFRANATAVALRTAKSVESGIYVEWRLPETLLRPTSTFAGFNHALFAHLGLLGGGR